MGALGGGERNRRQAMLAILGRRIGGWRGLFQLIHLADHHENHERHDDEIDNRVDEHADFDGRRAGFVRCGQGFVGRVRQVDKDIVEIDVAE